MSIKLGIVLPCYNEQEVLVETNKRLLSLFKLMKNERLITTESTINYVDDGSTDKTWTIIEELARADSHVHGIKLSRNRGHQNAVLAGLSGVDADALISIDADLQDDINAIKNMVEEFINGSEVVYGVRKSRSSDTIFKRTTAKMYYKLLARLGVDIVYNHADFRLLSRRAVSSLLQYTEVNLFLRGIVPLLGYRTSTVYYDRTERFAGTSKYPLKKMLAFALDGITSFSVVPLRMITALGFLVSILSFSMIIWIIYGRLYLNTVVPGWASEVVPIYFLGGIQLLSLGIVGEYIAKIYLEIKRRPRFFIEKEI